MATKAQREYARQYYHRKRAEKLNGKANGKVPHDLISVVKAYQVLHTATSDGQVKSELTKSFANIVSKTL